MKLVGPINHWRADPSGWVGSAVMLFFAGLAAWRWQGSGLLFYALTFLRDIAAAWFLISRREDQARVRFGRADFLAYVSSAMPFMYFGPTEVVTSMAFIISDVLAIIGFTLATIALFELGSAFGVSPANRGRVTSGVYRFIGHPMYLGYILSEVGLCFINPLNIGILFGSSFFYYARMRVENLTLGVRVLTPSR